MDETLIHEPRQMCILGHFMTSWVIDSLDGQVSEAGEEVEAGHAVEGAVNLSVKETQ